MEGYWDDLSLAEFWSKYEIIYIKAPEQKKKGKTKIIPLKNNKSFIRRRSEMAVIRYYLNYSNDEDLARRLLILFLPFRNEMKEIDSRDVKQVLYEFKDLINTKRKIFEKYKVMSELIATIQP